ncbi:MAG: ATP-binding protein [Eubacterium sp.]|nr:ATP-binding protein [Eubacterium sp.]
MAGNVVQHGFKKDNKKNHSVDIRVTHRDDEMILRLQDDCRPFDPASRNRILEPEDTVRHIGIRLVYHIAEDIQYQNLLGLNVLTVRI